jgi:hypothetical protein
MTAMARRSCVRLGEKGVAGGVIFSHTEGVRANLEMVS